MSLIICSIPGCQTTAGCICDRTSRTSEVLNPVPRGYLRDWNFKLGEMPADGRFEVLRIYPEVYRNDPESLMVIEPRSGRMFRPIAWRRRDDGDTRHD